LELVNENCYCFLMGALNRNSQACWMSLESTNNPKTWTNKETYCRVSQQNWSQFQEVGRMT
jgi:hypothetical protein